MSQREAAPGYAYIVLLAVLCTGWGLIAVYGEEFHSNPWLKTWIPATCCVTNDCCWEITSSEVKSLPDDNWEVRSTGQVRKRTDYSPDGRYYRCACDYDAASRHWIKHQGANTRCIFVPMQLF